MKIKKINTQRLFILSQFLNDIVHVDFENTKELYNGRTHWKMVMKCETVVHIHM